MSFHKKIMLALGLAFITGLLANFSNQEMGHDPAWINFLIQTCEFFGKLFLNGLKMVVIPLVMTSVICGVSQISTDRDFGRLGLKTLLLYSLTGLLAVCTGLLCVNLVEPGDIDQVNKEAILANQGPGSSHSMEQAMSTANDGWQNLAQIFTAWFLQICFLLPLKVNC